MFTFKNKSTLTTAGRVPRLAAFGLLLTAMALPAAARANEVVYNKLLQSSAWVVVPQGDNRVMRGSGVLVDLKRRWVVTNYHVVGEKDRALIFFAARQDGQLMVEEEHYVKNVRDLAIRGKVIARDASKDLAIVELERLPEEAKAVTLAKTSPRMAQTVHVVANQGGTGALWTYSYGKVRSVLVRSGTIGVGEQSQSINVRTVVTTLPVNQGDSGGPVVNDKAELVALVSSGDMKRRLVTSCIDITEIRGMMQRAGQVQVVKIRGNDDTPAVAPIQAIAEQQPPVNAQPQPRVPTPSMTGLWIGKLTRADGKFADLALNLLPDGRFIFASDLSTGGKVDKRGEWKLQNGRLELRTDGKIWIAGRIIQSDANGFTLDDGTDRIAFTRSRRANPAPAPRLVNVAGTTWTGTENLQGFGKLTFRFGANGKVTMIDAQQTVDGTFTQNGDAVTLTFFNGQTIYRGRVTGQAMTGSAAGGNGQTWTFTLRIEMPRGQQ